MQSFCCGFFFVILAIPPSILLLKSYAHRMARGIQYSCPLITRWVPYGQHIQFRRGEGGRAAGYFGGDSIASLPDWVASATLWSPSFRGSLCNQTIVCIKPEGMCVCVETCRANIISLQQQLGHQGEGSGWKTHGAGPSCRFHVEDQATPLRRFRLSYALFPLL